MSKLKYFVISVILVGLAFGLQAASPPPSGGYAIGDYVSDFSLKNVDGKKVSLKGLSDVKGVVLIFTCNTCPYSVAYEERIVALDKKLRPKGYPVVAINPNSAKVADDSYEKMKARAEKAGFTFPYLDDSDQSIARRYGATRTPHVYVLQREGKKHRVAYIGAIDDNYKDAAQVSQRYVEDAVYSLLKGKPVKVSKTKAIGCTIKWAVNSTSSVSGVAVAASSGTAEKLCAKRAAAAVACAKARAQATSNTEAKVCAKKVASAECAKARAQATSNTEEKVCAKKAAAAVACAKARAQATSNTEEKVCAKRAAAAVACAKARAQAASNTEEKVCAKKAAAEKVASAECAKARAQATSNTEEKVCAKKAAAVACAKARAQATSNTEEKVCAKKAAAEKVATAECAKARAQATSGTEVKKVCCAKEASAKACCAKARAQETAAQAKVVEEQAKAQPEVPASSGN